MVKKSLTNDLYLELEGVLHYLLLCRQQGQQPDEATIRDIAGRRPDIMAQLQSAREDGSMVLWPGPNGQTYDPRNLSEHVHTMIGRKRLDHLHACLDVIQNENIPGDLIETGVWRGGATIFMRAHLAAHGVTDRTVWVADSFVGLPPPSVSEDIGYDLSTRQQPILAIDEERVRDLFRRYDLLDGQVRFLPGWFRDTLPAAPIEQLALLRLDGDLYESTMDALLALYDKVVPGGYVVVDDYGALPPCRRAVEDFRAERGIAEPLEQIDWTGMAWRKAGAQSAQPAQPVRTSLGTASFVPNDHYYSPVVNLDELAKRADRLFDPAQPLDGLSLDLAAHKEMLKRLTPLANDLPFGAKPQDGLRYGYENGNFSYFDAILFASMMRLHRPRRILEVGSGHSSCLILDVNERYFDGAIECSFIEPYPELLRSLLRPGEAVRLHDQPVQDVGSAPFDELQAGDILFIDSTHVSKAGSDVNHHFFKTFPRINPGVLICMHDVFHPFEYPREWFFQDRRSWNELYLLRAFLSYNAAFETVFFTNWLEHQCPGMIAGQIPQAAANLGGSFWMRKT
jgi:hypothetical protein